ncbi:hypothetical protein [Burkholderia multivorans]|uniref:hypothetical protein n=1 Tax=Burkholderia multivorans TaxID=87883 RepID=UPI001C2228AF|nr:hypothetical protein [Burkholderia multivorans]MBU9605397.1 hypothetical protein [Burkholderia multivorans]MBU9626231.1 hypothetical protein [Burkholderia multivorans]
MRPQPASLRAGRRVRIASPHRAMRSERSKQYLRRTHIGRDESSSAVHRRATYATERAQRLR